MSSPDPSASMESAPALADEGQPASAARAPRRARGQLRVDALLASAAEVFAQKGFDAATMTEIAAQADSSIGSLYQFFRTKESVAEALLRTQVDALWQRFDALAGRAASLATPELGRVLVRFFIDFRSAHPSFGTLVDMPGPPLQAVVGVRAKVRERVEDVLVRHAPAVDRKTLHAMAPIVQHSMKIAIALRSDLDAAEREAAMGELETMLAGYLRARLAATA